MGISPISEDPRDQEGGGEGNPSIPFCVYVITTRNAKEKHKIEEKQSIVGSAMMPKENCFVVVEKMENETELSLIVAARTGRRSKLASRGRVLSNRNKPTLSGDRIALAGT